MAAPAAQAWAQQAPYGDHTAYPPYVQQQPDVFYARQSPAPLPVYKRPGVVFGAAAVAAVIAVGALLATWMSKDNVSTTPVNNTGTPTQQVVIPLAPAAPRVAPPSQSVAAAQPAPRSTPRQQAPVPRVAPPNPSAVSPAPLAPAPNSPAAEPIPVPEQKQDPEPRQKQDPPDKFNPGDPENPTPDDLLCHPNPPGCTGDQKAPAQQQQPAP
jgi:hypothetical protein